MDVVKHAVTKTLPAYLQTLPLPDTAAGFAELSANDWRTLAPFLGTLLAILLITARSLSGGAPKAKKTRVNTKVQLSAQKVVDFCKVADIEDSGKRVYCRCWKSATFPLCDGSHAKHNAETGDNVGPLIVQK